MTRHRPTCASRGEFGNLFAFPHLESSLSVSVTEPPSIACQSYSIQHLTYISLSRLINSAALLHLISILSVQIYRSHMRYLRLGPSVISS